MKLLAAAVLSAAGVMGVGTQYAPPVDPWSMSPWPVQQRIEEDDLSWDCRTMGDRVCGDARLRADLNRCSFWYKPTGPRYHWCVARANFEAQQRRALD